MNARADWTLIFPPVLSLTQILLPSELFLYIFESEETEVAMSTFADLHGVSEEAHPIPDQGLMGITEENQVFKCLFLSDPQMADDDSFFYLGTTTGDILKMNPRTKLLADTGPAKDKFSLVSRDCQTLLCPAVFS